MHIIKHLNGLCCLKREGHMKYPYNQKMQKTKLQEPLCIRNQGQNEKFYCRQEYNKNLQEV